MPWSLGAQGLSTHEFSAVLYECKTQDCWGPCRAQGHCGSHLLGQCLEATSGLNLQQALDSGPSAQVRSCCRDSRLQRPQAYH